MAQVIVHGWSFSPFLRAVRIALNEKGVAHTVREMAPPDAATAAFRAKSPFGKVPVLEHDGLVVRETPAILHYIDACYPTPALRPTDAGGRSRVEGLMLAVANYLYPTGVMGVFFQHAYVAANGGVPDPIKVDAAAAATAPVLDALEREAGQPFLAGADFSLADCLLAPMLENLALAPAGAALIAARPRLAAIAAAASARPSVIATRAPIPRFGLAA